MKFTEFNFKDYIQEALKDLNFVEATEVQEKLILAETWLESPKPDQARPTLFCCLSSKNSMRRLTASKR